MDKQNKNCPDNQKCLLTDEQFVMVCLDLFTAGSETTANTLEFALMYVTLCPRVQKNVQNEIDEVIGSQRLPCTTDRQRMPYTQATILEAQRMCNVIPLVHRVATRDTHLGPYRIKKSDVLVVNMHSVHKNERVWGDPELFRPERFLDENGNLTNNLSHLIPFGMGKRVCMGEMLAKHTLFTYFTSVLQRYSFHVPPEREAPNLQPTGKGFTISPEPYTVLAKPRNFS
jgi:methyl farnesoate epoxidase/farnesoate epoxidase